MLISTFAFITKRSMQINQNPTNKRILGSKGDKQKHCGLRPRSRLQHGLITGAPSSFIIIITLTAHPTSNKEEQGKLLERGERESAEANYPRRKFKGGKEGKIYNECTNREACLWLGVTPEEGRSFRCRRWTRRMTRRRRVPRRGPSWRRPASPAPRCSRRPRSGAPGTAASSSLGPAAPVPSPSSPGAASSCRAPALRQRRLRRQGRERDAKMEKPGCVGACGAQPGGGGGSRGLRGSSTCARAPRRRARGRPPHARPCCVAGPKQRRRMKRVTRTTQRGRGGAPLGAWTSRSRARAASATWTLRPRTLPPRRRASASTPSPSPPRPPSRPTWTPLTRAPRIVAAEQGSRWIACNGNKQDCWTRAGIRGFPLVELGWLVCRRGRGKGRKVEWDGEERGLRGWEYKGRGQLANADGAPLLCSSLCCDPLGFCLALNGFGIIHFACVTVGVIMRSTGFGLSGPVSVHQWPRISSRRCRDRMDMMPFVLENKQVRRAALQ
jgi:hypothetical protein